MAHDTGQGLARGVWRVGWCLALLALVLPLTAAAQPPASTAAVGAHEPLLAPACAEAAPGAYGDVDAGDRHATAIACLAWWRIIEGFSDGTFRPAAAVTRGQVATMLVNTLLAADADLPAAGPGFPDTAGSAHGTAVARLAETGIARGVTPDSFRPNAPVSRAEMASFLDRLLDHLDIEVEDATESEVFSDLTATPHTAAILRLADLGIAEGDGTGAFAPADPVSRAQMASFLARTLGLAVSAGMEVRAAQAGVQPDALNAAVCTRHVRDRRRADALLEGRYLWEPHPEVELGTTLTWTEDPFDDRNWRFQFHALRWVWHLINTGSSTGDARYLDRAEELVRSWVENNPRDGAADPMAWNDHAVAWRARVLTCLARQRPAPEWLDQALRDHADALADPDFYVDRGNHALNQDVGLLAAACHLQRWQQRDLAIERIGHLARTSVDEQGVTNEQSVEYQVYNHNRYRDAAGMISACGREDPAWVARIDLMPEVLAHMTLPDGTYEALGDTDRREVRPLGDPATTWLRTDGADGAPPADRTAVFDAGFYLTRSGWGEERPMGEETFLSARFGPQPDLHGHDDHGSVTLYAERQRLVTDPGKYRYGNLPARAHVVSQQAHNVVTIDAACTERVEDRSPISSVMTDGEVDRFRIEINRCRDHHWTRDVAFRLADGAVVVVDRVDGPSGAAITQRWQLEVDAEVTAIDPTGAHAVWPDGTHLRLEQLLTAGGGDAVVGGEDPLRGWVSRAYGQLDPAPNLAFPAAEDGTARFVTVLRPGATRQSPASTLLTTETGIEVRVPDGAGRETVLTFER